MSTSWRVAAAATFALFVLHWAWAWLVPHPHLGFLATAGLFSIWLLPVMFAFLRRRPRAPLWAGILALFYFCAAIASIRVDGGPWPGLELLLSLLIVFAAGWPGIAAKMAKRRAAPPPNV